MKPQVQSIKLIDNTNIAGQKEAREFVKVTETSVKVAVESIVIRKGFNIREDFGNITELAESIKNVGLLKPIAVDILKDGTAVLTDGERRYRAILLIREESEELAKKFEYVLATTNGGKMSEADRVIAMMTHNTGKPLEPIEEAEGFRRLRDEHKMELAAIARSVGRSVPYVEQRLLLADSDEEEKQAVREKKISATAQQHLVRTEKDPEKRKKIVKEVNAKGKRVKVKDVKPKTSLKKEVDNIIAMVKKADKMNKDAAVANALMMIDGALRGLKELV